MHFNYYLFPLSWREHICDRITLIEVFFTLIYSKNLKCLEKTFLSKGCVIVILFNMTLDMFINLLKFGKNNQMNIYIRI